MKNKYREFDEAAYLKNEKMIADYLTEIMGDYDPKVLPYALGVVARAQGMTKLSKKTGLSRAALYKALSEKGNPSFATITKILAAYGIVLQPKIDNRKKAA